MAMIEAMKEVIWLQGLPDDLRIDQDLLKINCDSMSAICLAKNQVYHERTKHIDVRLHFIREILNEGDFELVKVAQRRIPLICLLKWFWKEILHIVKSCSISF